MMKSLIISLTIMTGLISFVPISQNKGQTKPTPINKVMLERGKTIYLQRCLACHQLDGGGVPHLNAPLDGASAVIGPDKAKIIRIMLKGMSERAEIDGEFYSNSMAAQNDLNDQQIADVLTYIRNSWSNKASAVTPAEVKAVRAKTK